MSDANLPLDLVSRFDGIIPGSSDMGAEDQPATPLLALICAIMRQLVALLEQFRAGILPPGLPPVFRAAMSDGACRPVESGDQVPLSAATPYRFGGRGRVAFDSGGMARHSGCLPSLPDSASADAAVALRAAFWRALPAMWVGPSRVRRCPVRVRRFGPAPSIPA